MGGKRSRDRKEATNEWWLFVENGEDKRGLQTKQFSIEWQKN